MAAGRVLGYRLGTGGAATVTLKDAATTPADAVSLRSYMKVLEAMILAQPCVIP